MNYTLNQLQVFLKVAKSQSVTKAAEELHLTQPAVSIQLKNFQNQFDIPLTEVIGRKLYVTDFGKEIAEAADKDAKWKEKEMEYTEKFANPYGAAARGYIDEVILPDVTREKLIRAYKMLENKVEVRPKRKHGNIPL